MRFAIGQVVSGLSHMHSIGYIHRDIKPSNIYVTRDGVVKLGDFSISRSFHQTPASKTNFLENSNSPMINEN